jgi:uncharacterized membrane protein YidH (DUF202 family)
MKNIIIGLVILITGIVVSTLIVIEIESLEAISEGKDNQPSLLLLLVPIMIPLGIFTITAGVGDLMAKKKKKKRNYYRPWLNLLILLGL